MSVFINESESDSRYATQAQVEGAIQSIAANIALPDIEGRSAQVKKTTPSGFFEFGENLNTNLGSTPISMEDGLGVITDTISPLFGDNRIYMGSLPTSTNGGDTTRAMVNGYRLRLQGNINDGLTYGLDISANPGIGGRLDMVALEVWKEEVDKNDGLFFLYGNTQSKADVNIPGSVDYKGSVFSDNPAGYVDSAYYTPSTGVYAVKASDATQEFLFDPDNNIGILGSGNFFQIRYRLIELSSHTDAWDQDPALKDSAGQYYRPQGQLALRPSTGSLTDALGAFLHQDGGSQSTFQNRKHLDDSGLWVGGFTDNVNINPLTPISNLSSDGFVYLIPVCLIHRRNSSGWSLNNHNGGSLAPAISDRPDGLHYNIIDHRDVWDLRHKVYCNGITDEELHRLYTKTFEKILKSDYRNRFDKLRDFDNDGNGSGLIDSQIHGNIILESTGIGATVPNAVSNQHITKLDDCNNLLFIGLDGMRRTFSDSEKTEEFSVLIEDHADGAASKTHSNELSLVSYNSGTHAIEADLALLGSANLNPNTAVLPEFSEGTIPLFKWGSGFNMAGSLIKNSTTNWSFSIGEFGGIYFDSTVIVDIHVGSVYVDTNTKRWIISGGHINTTEVPMLPDYDNGNDGSVLPPDGSVLTLVLGPGDPAITLVGGTIRYQDAIADLPNINEPGIFLGYNNTAHNVDLNDSINCKFSIDYKRGSSFLQELPYKNRNAFKGIKLSVDGLFVPQTPDLIPASEIDTHTKHIDLSALIGKNSIIKTSVSAGDFDFEQATYPSLIKDASTYKMWYTGTNSGITRIGHQTSPDGIIWTKVPGAGTGGSVLDLGTAGDFDLNSIESSAIIKDGPTYKIWYTGTNSGVNRIGHATSTDGISWTKVVGSGTGNSVLDLGVVGKFDETELNVDTVMKDGATYRMWYTGINSVGDSRIGYATSVDGINWSKVSGNSGDDSILPDLDVSDAKVIRENSTYKMWYTKATESILYAISNDGSNWFKIGSVMEPVSGSFFDLGLKGMAVIKDGSAYKHWMSGLFNSKYEIGYGYLAMSDSSNTGSSTDGTYSSIGNVNHGFSSSDSVILFYERLASQNDNRKTAGTETISILGSKDGMFTNLGTGFSSNLDVSKGRDIVANYYPSFDKNGNGSNALYNSGGPGDVSELFSGDHVIDADYINTIAMELDLDITQDREVILKVRDLNRFSMRMRNSIEISFNLNNGNTQDENILNNKLEDDTILGTDESNGVIPLGLYIIVRRYGSKDLQLLLTSNDTLGAVSDGLGGSSTLSLFNLLGNPLSK